jgi:hypothetical protein
LSYIRYKISTNNQLFGMEYGFSDKYLDFHPVPSTSFLKCSRFLDSLSYVVYEIIYNIIHIIYIVFKRQYRLNILYSSLLHRHFVKYNFSLFPVFSILLTWFHNQIHIHGDDVASYNSLSGCIYFGFNVIPR